MFSMFVWDRFERPSVAILLLFFFSVHTMLQCLIQDRIVEHGNLTTSVCLRLCLKA
jgi:hypothetical protein